MSTKVCVTAVKPTWKDTVTIGQLNQIIEGLYALGFDDDTPVTYLNDDDHVWLETVNDDDVVIVLEPEPRVVDELGFDERYSDWLDCEGDRWGWNGGWRCVDYPEDEGLGRTTLYAPYTEIL